MLGAFVIWTIVLHAVREQQFEATYVVGAPEALTIHSPNQDWQDPPAAASTVLSAPDNSAQGSLLTADSLEPHAMVDTPAESQGMQEQQVVSHVCHNAFNSVVSSLGIK